MKNARKLGVQFALLCAGVSPCLVKANNPQFTSRVYFVIHESTPFLVQRGRKVIEKEFAETFEAVPALGGQDYQIAADGNQLVFSMVTESDLRSPFQTVVSDIVGQLNGR